MLHYTELLVKCELRPKFSFQMSVLADALREGGKWHFGWVSYHLPHWIWNSHESLLQELPEHLFPPQCSQVRLGQSCTSLPCYLREICLCPVDAPSCSFAVPGTSAQPWALPQPGVEEVGTLLQQQRALPESIAGHCSRVCLVSVKPCQGCYKAFLKSSEGISTFLPSCHLKQQQQLLPSQQ